MSQVTREEFQSLSNLTHETASTVNSLVPAVQQLAETSRETLKSISLLRDEISNQQAEIVKTSSDLKAQIYEFSRPDKNTIMTQVSLFLVFIGLLGTLGKLYVDNSVGPVDKDINRIEQDINKLDAREYSPKAREMDARISAKIEHIEKSLEFHQSILKELRDWHINGKTN